VNLLDDNNQSVSTLTDSDGHFSFEEVPAGNYQLFASHPAYVFIPGGGSPRHKYSLLAGQGVKNSVLKLTPAAVVRGRVTDQDGDSMDNLQVQLISAAKSTPRFMALVVGRGSGGVMTNDIGEFRMSGIAPGRYYVKAIPALPKPQKPKREGAQLTAQVPTYYPAAITKTAATALELHGGEEITVNITLQRSTLFPVSGTVKTGSGGLVDHGVVTARQGYTPYASSLVTNGKFEVALPMGEFTFQGIDANANSDGNPGLVQTYKLIEVPEGGLQDLKLVIGPDKTISTKITGVIHAEAGSSLPRGERFSLSLETMREAEVQEQPDPEDGIVFSEGPGFGFAESAPDGSFELKNVPDGIYYIEVSSQWSGMVDWYTKAVQIAGHDVANSGIRVEGQDLQVEITMSPNGGLIEGVVNDKDLHPVIDAMVVVVPDEVRAKRLNLYENATTDQNGKFLVRGLEPGNYTVYALQNEEYGTWYKEENRKKYEKYGVAITVQEREKARADVRLAPPEATNE
jgi:protocatechuate 3,4-dioxygenase beta subunit